ncbi:hypothetical protein CR513_13679, partial [Mucuna pruriens]
LVEKLKLPTLAHSRSYKLQWLNNKGKFTVSLVFTLAKNEDEVTHEGVTNKLSFVYRGQKVTLEPLSLKEVNEDQMKMMLRREKEKKE